ncbi:MAG: hypothetical protein IKL97_08045 [Eggerthellaceae bacterium]|nr:hypothetical protein [Eggerthellaceae bacterium]
MAYLAAKRTMYAKESGKASTGGASGPRSVKGAVGRQIDGTNYSVV